MRIMSSMAISFSLSLIRMIWSSNLLMIKSLMIQILRKVYQKKNNQKSNKLSKINLN
jgi:hypothetical protein